jgi:hypothetical protein
MRSVKLYLGVKTTVERGVYGQQRCSQGGSKHNHQVRR